MGASLGSLVVSLGLDAAEFTSGLTKADFQAKKLAQTLTKGIGVAASATAAGLTAMAGAATAAFAVFDTLAKDVGDFQDLAEMTNANAEELASFSTAAATAGVEVKSIADATIKLTKSLVGVDDESKAAGAALAAIGLNVEEFKKLDPVAQYDAVAKSLNGYADSADKTAIAQALFGKSGAEQLKVFKVLEEQGGRNIIITAEQIKQADEYADNQAKARSELTQYAQVLATQAIPALTVLTKSLSDAAREMLGIDGAGKKLTSSNAVGEFAKDAAIFLAGLVDVAKNVADGFRFIGKSIGATAAIAAALKSGNLSEAFAINAEARKDMDTLFGSSFKDRVISNFKAMRENAKFDPFQTDSTELARRGKGPLPSLSFGGAVKSSGGASKAAKEIKEVVTESDKYFESLQKQLQGTRDLNVEETLLAEIQSGRLKIAGKASQDELLGLARQIDQTKEATRVSSERQDQRNKEYEDSIKAVKELKKAEDDRLAGFLENTPSVILEKQRSDVEFLTKAFEDARISEQQYLEAVTERLNLGGEKLKEQKSLADELGLSFTSAFEDAIVGGKNLSDVLKGLEQDLIRIITRKLVTEPLGNALSGAFSGGGDFFGGLIGSIFGKAGGGYASPFSLTPVNENGPEMFDYMGKQFMRTGKTGVNVTPNSRLGGGMNQTVNFYNNGPVDRRTQGQLAAAALSGARSGQRNL